MNLGAFRLSMTILLGLFVSFFAGCGAADKETSAPISKSDPTAKKSDVLKPDEIELALNWYPEAEHGGYFTALLEGDFAAEGINVKITPGGKGVPVIQNVATGRVPFAVANADQVLTGRASQADVVAVFAPIQTSPRCIMVHEKSGIRSFAELKNVKLAVNPSPFASVLKKNVPLEGCQIVPYEGQVSAFLLDENYAQQGYVFSEPFVARQNGGDPHSLMAADIGFNPYTSVLIVSDATLKENPGLVRRVVAASQRGWLKYLDNPAKTNEHIHEKNPEMPVDALEFGVTELKKLCLTGAVNETNFGLMTAGRWVDLLKQLEACEVIEPGSVNAEDAFRSEFIR